MKIGVPRFDDFIKLIERGFIEFGLLVSIVLEALYHLDVLNEKRRLLNVANVMLGVFLHDYELLFVFENFSFQF